MSYNRSVIVFSTAKVDDILSNIKSTRVAVTFGMETTSKSSQFNIKVI